MDKDLRASLIASGAAAILSMIVGFASGIGFLVLLLRAVVGGLLFGGLVYGGFFLARRFLPELFGKDGTDEASGFEGEAAAETGRALNIVLPGEEAAESYSGSIVDDSVLAGSEEAEDLGADAETSPSPAAEASPPEARGGVSQAAQASSQEGRRPRLFSSRASSQAPAEEEDFAYANESLLEEEEGQAAEPAAPLQAPRIAEGMDSLDVLPDLDSLSESFGPVVPAGGAEPHDYEEPAPRVRASSSVGNPAGNDPAMLAQAVRTLLKRDQER